jgi:hypothetical protein
LNFADSKGVNSFSISGLNCISFISIQNLKKKKVSSKPTDTKTWINFFPDIEINKKNELISTNTHTIIFKFIIIVIIEGSVNKTYIIIDLTLYNYNIILFSWKSGKKS